MVKLFGYEYYGVEPDLIMCGKGISGSLPLSAVLGRSELIELDPTLTSTHGGHPMSCAAALGNLESFVEDIPITSKGKKQEVFQALCDAAL